MDKVNIKINGMSVSVTAGSTILEAAREVGIDIPTLCYMKEMNEIGACRMCVVEVKGARSLVAACVYPVNEGMEVVTNSPKVLNSRKTTLELLLSTHDRNCLSCSRSGKCEFQTLCRELGVEDASAFDGEKPVYELDETKWLVRDNNKCVLCRRCAAACEDQYVGVIGANGRGIDTHIGCAFEKPLGDVSCIACGQCIVNCPVGALKEKSYTDEVFEAIADPEKVVVVQTAPAVRAGLGEEFGYPMGTNVEGKMVAALRRLGFDKVFDTDFGADLTIMEEAHEFLDRVQNGGVLPMITSCSPGWVKFCEHYYPDFTDHLSTCKSPQNMFGAIVKSYWAEKAGVDPHNIVSVSVMPCTAKKFEITRDDENGAGEDLPDVDYSLTTRELATMIEKVGLNFRNLPDEEFDNPLGEDTGAAVIFGATGGVMEAALRTAADVLEGKSVENVDYKEVRGTEGIKEATYNIAGMDVKVAVASGAKNAAIIMDKLAKGEADYHFIEIMGCPGGCVNGGGQPIIPARVKNFTDYKAIRASALYKADEAATLRKSHENPEIIKLYDEFLEKPNSHKAHQLLHTSYVARGKYKD